MNLKEIEEIKRNVNSLEIATIDSEEIEIQENPEIEAILEKYYKNYDKFIQSEMEWYNMLIS